MFPEIQPVTPCAPAMLDIPPVHPVTPVAPLRHHRPGRIRECKVCLGEHDQETHDATVSVHEWFRYQVLKNMDW